MKYRIVIPSYKRPNMLKAKTLSLLDRCNIKHDTIDILLENKEEELSYNLNKSYNVIIHNQIGIGNVRNFIRNYYRENNYNYILCIDDDIEEIYDYKKEMVNLDKFIKDMFKITEDNGLNYWGISNYHNVFYMNQTVTTTLKYIAGAFTGIIIDKKKDMIVVNYDTLEDFVSTLEYYLRDGGVVRANSVWLKTKYFNIGGIEAQYNGTDNRKKANNINAIKIKKEYKDMVNIIKKEWGVDLQINSRFRLC